MSVKRPDIFKGAVLEDYTSFQSIERTIHLDDIPNKNDEKFMTSNISFEDKSLLSEDTNVLWFKNNSPENKNHFYGNVRFSISINKLLKHLLSNGYKLYWIETVFWEKSVDSRIMLTKKNLEGVPNDSIDSSLILPRESSMRELGYPIYQDDSGIFYELKNLTGFQYSQKRHEVEFVIEPTEEDNLWLYQNCDRLPVDHSQANKKTEDGRYVPRSCHKHNSMRKEECPTPYSKKETEQEMMNRNLQTIHRQLSTDKSCSFGTSAVLMEKVSKNISLVDPFSQVFISIETGGLQPRDGIIQIAVECGDYKYSTYVTPETGISEQATEKHGFTNRDDKLFHIDSGNIIQTVSIKKALEEILGKLKEFTNCIIIAHYVHFTSKFIEHFVDRSGLRDSYNSIILGYIDIINVFKTIEGKSTHKYDLNSLCERLIPDIEINNSNTESKVKCLKNLLSIPLVVTNEILLNSSISLEWKNDQSKVEFCKNSLKILVENKSMSSIIANKISEIHIDFNFLKKASEAGALFEELSQKVDGKPRVTKDKKIINKINSFFDIADNNNSILTKNENQ
ncbi:unnamed protein product [Meganyctiphanes norvegica]|uniref:PML C-terminal domain-containing protein n=1 Tax=Meganyctiphanes norvegica TaxID=48144 RepID=A0AAV2SE52_MEGNR